MVSKDQGSAAYCLSDLEIIERNLDNTFAPEQHAKPDKNKNCRDTKPF